MIVNSSLLYLLFGLDFYSDDDCHYIHGIHYRHH